MAMDKRKKAKVWMALFIIGMVACAIMTMCQMNQAREASGRGQQPSSSR